MKILVINTGSSSIKHQLFDMGTQTVLASGVAEKIGENSSFIREASCRGLKRLGIELDSEKNDKPGNGIREVSQGGREVKVLVIPTNEERRIAQETERAIIQGYRSHEF